MSFSPADDGVDINKKEEYSMKPSRVFKKALAFLAGTALMCSACMVSVFAADPYTEWNDPDSLPTRGTYKLMTDVHISDKITVGSWASTPPAEPTSQLVLDLNGYTVTAEGGEAVFIQTNGGVTIEDSSAEKTGKITNAGVTSSSKILIQDNGGKFTLSGGILENTTSSGYALSLNAGSNAEITGGSIINTAKSGYALFVNSRASAVVSGGVVKNTVDGGNAVYINSSAVSFTLEGTGQVIQEGTFSSDSAIYANNSGDNQIIIAGGSVKSNSMGIEAYFTPVTITGGSIDAATYALFTRNATVNPADDSDVSITAGTALIYDLSGSNNTIMGGEISTPAIVKSYTSTEEDKPVITGGAFTDTSDEQDLAQEVKGYIPTETDSEASVSVTTNDGKTTSFEKTAGEPMINETVTGNPSEVTASADISYVVVIPETIDFGKVDKSMETAEQPFTVQVTDALLEEGASITVKNITAAEDMVMKNKDGAGTKTLPFELAQADGLFTFTQAELEATGQQSIESSVTCSPKQDLKAAGSYKGYMTFEVTYVPAA